jgi:hypothetical protein
MADYPVVFDVQRPEKFERPQMALRIIIGVIIYFILSWVGGIIYLIFPAVAAVLASQKGGEKYLEEDGERVAGWIRWIVAIYAYLLVLVDRFPSEKPEELVRFEVRTSGTPTVGSALLRLIYSIPSALVLGLLSIVGFVVLLIAIISVLISESYPDGLYDFQRGILRWEARLLGYHASLVGEYPPFALDTGPESGGAPAPAAPAEPAPAPSDEGSGAEG